MLKICISYLIIVACVKNRVDSDELASSELHFYAPNFVKVEGAYCFGLVLSSVRSKVLQF